MEWRRLREWRLERKTVTDGIGDSVFSAGGSLQHHAKPRGPQGLDEPPMPTKTLKFWRDAVRPAPIISVIDRLHWLAWSEYGLAGSGTWGQWLRVNVLQGEFACESEPGRPVGLQFPLQCWVPYRQPSMVVLVVLLILLPVSEMALKMQASLGMKKRAQAVAD